MAIQFIYLFNNAAFYPIIDAKGDTIGINYYSPKKFPAKPVVGSTFPGHFAEMNLFPYEFKITAKRFFNFSETDYKGNGTNYSGFVTVRKTVKQNSNSITVYTPYTVVGKEDIQISGKTYTAYKLFNAQWIKSTGNNVVTEDPQVYFNDPNLSNKVKDYFSGLANKKSYQRAMERLNAKLDKFSFTNEYGYMENLMENWFVPELGIFVKSKMYDGDGAVMMETRVISIK
jgi:hypothetical protein